MHQEVKNLQLLVLACCILHNIIRDRYPRMHVHNMINREDVHHQLIPGDLRGYALLEDMQLLLKDYFNRVRAGPWQGDIFL